jgi:hypothetical protein
MSAPLKKVVGAGGVGGLGFGFSLQASKVKETKSKTRRWSCLVIVQIESLVN